MCLGWLHGSCTFAIDPGSVRYEENPTFSLELHGRRARIARAGEPLWTGHLGMLKLEGSWLRFEGHRLHLPRPPRELVELLERTSPAAAGTPASVPQALFSLRSKAAA